MLASKEVLKALLDNPTDLANVKSFVSDDFTYVSLNYSNPDLTRIMPWCGTNYGAESLVKTFVDVARYWELISFDPEILFGEGENAAIFGRFTYRSKVMGRIVTTPFAVFARVRDGKCIYMQFMEDTLATSASFRSGGTWVFKSNPNGDVVSF